MATIDQQFVEYIVKTLVNNPEKVQVNRTIDEKGVLLELSVEPEDVGRVIGRRGVTAQSIRTLLRALGTKNDARYNLKIVNTDEDYHTSRADIDPNASSDTDETATAYDESTTDDEADREEDDSEEDEDEEDDTLAERTRAELSDLDDLDI